MTAEWILNSTREQQHERGAIRVHPSGRYVNPLALKAEDIHIEDIAHHLSNICRYTGACPRFYSVAQHSVHVAQHLLNLGSSADLILAGLLHDSAEYVFNDIASPVKHDPRMQWYCDSEHRAAELIFSVFGLAPELLPQTKRADDAIFDREATSWWGGKVTIVPWVPHHAERVFLEYFQDIQHARRDGK